MEKHFLTIAHASDLHICKDGNFAYEVSDSLTGLRNFIKDIKKLNFNVDFLCITGDLSDDGSISSYKILKENLDNLPIPYFIIPGNHDNREKMSTIFENHKYLNKRIKNRIFHSFTVHNIKIILLDSLTDGEPNGSLPKDVLNAIEQELSTGNKSLIFLHHPPFPTGIGFMDKQPFHSANDFLTTLNKNSSNILNVGCGHIHRAMFINKGGINFTISPSTAMQLDLNLNEDAPGDFVLETPGYLIYRISVADNAFPEITTHVVQIATDSAMEITYPFND